VYGALALGCAVFYLLAKVVENKFMKEGDDLGFFTFILGFVGFFALFQAADALNLFS
jgi:hypothetical protein